MEVFLDYLDDMYDVVCLLHARGGVSMKMAKVYIIRESSPRPWRCFPLSSALDNSAAVFSTPVEVFPLFLRSQATCRGLLHARGGVSFHQTASLSSKKSSPRPWRCFRVLRILFPPRAVFSTPVEVFLTGEKAESHYNGLLHARGGVSSKR